MLVNWHRCPKRTLYLRLASTHNSRPVPDGDKILLPLTQRQRQEAIDGLLYKTQGSREGVSANGNLKEGCLNEEKAPAKRISQRARKD